MPPGCRHLQRPLDVLLSLDLCKVGRILRRRQPGRVQVGLVGRNRVQTLQVGRQLAQVFDRDDLQAVDQGCLGGIAGRDKDTANGLLVGQRCDGQDAVDVA